MQGIVIDNNVFASVIGVSFTTCLGLMAYIVQKLASLDGRVGILEDRYNRQNGDAPAPRRRRAPAPD